MKVALGCIAGIAGLLAGFAALLVSGVVLGRFQEGFGEQDPRRLLIGLAILGDRSSSGSS